MIKRLLDSKLPLLVYHPARVYDRGWFASAGQTGALPVFDTEFFPSSEVLSIINELKTDRILFGIRLACRDQEVLAFLNERNIINLNLVILSYDDPAEITGSLLHNTFYKVFLETIDINITENIKALDPHGLILRGFEAPGRVSRFTSFILMQWYLKNSSYPLFIHGGVGMHTCPGLFAAGAAGVVLDNQLYLTDEYPVAAGFKKLIRELEEKDSVVLGEDLNTRYRVFAKLGTKIVTSLKEKESALLSGDSGINLYADIKSNFVNLNSEVSDPLQSLFYLGQDAGFAVHFIKESTALKDVIHGLFTHTGHCLQAVDEHDPMAPHSQLAKAHNTEYPLIQGPMANVSDNTDFAEKILEQGGLPFFAMGNLPPHLAEKMLAEGSSRLPHYGAGLIGIEAFNRSITEHFALVKKYKVKFALLAGGVPAQVNELERCGIRTYLHTPSVAMLENAAGSQVTGFIFEGTEAGGHVGYLTSLVLWEMAIAKLLEYPASQLKKFTLLFAGGLSTEYASFFISGMTSGLARQGVKIGVSVGTCYLFTEEIITTQAIKKDYQSVILEKQETILVGKTVGLPSRTVKTEFTEKILEHEHKRINEKIPLKERKIFFEDDNIGSFLIAAKGFQPNFRKRDEQEPEYLHINNQEYLKKGNFSTGDSLIFFNKQTNIKEIHDQIFTLKNLLYNHLNTLEIFSGNENQINDEIAIIGMGCVYPDAANCEQLWDNITSKRYSISEVSSERFDAGLYYNTDKTDADKSYSRIAGEIKDFQFQYKKFGYQKEAGEKLSRSQQMILEAAAQAIAMADYTKKKKLAREKTGVIIASCLTNERINNLYFKSFYPELLYYLDQIEEFNNLQSSEKEILKNQLKVALTNNYQDQVPSNCIINIEAARIARHYGLKGSNYCVDAACASSFSAIDCAVKSLLSGENDYVLAGGLNTNLSPQIFVGFSKIHALSESGSYPFDERANGFVLGEGAGVLLLKRVKDALRDGDKIYGVIKGIGSSSDGTGKAIAAPKSSGQELAIRRCYASVKSEFSPNEIQYIETHGTSTKVGDATEIETLSRIFTGTTPVGLSSIKSQIGHLIGGAGIAGMIKLLLAIKNHTLPPNGNFHKISPDLKIKPPLYIIKDCQEWETAAGQSRKAAISAYGFGGINYHICIEEFTTYYKKLPRKIFNDPEYDFNDDRIVMIGMGCVLPGATGIENFWNNLQACRAFTSAIPAERFHNEYYHNITDPEFQFPLIKAGVITDYQFDNLKYKLPPHSVKNIDRVQLFALDAASQAIEQAGLKDYLKNENKVAVILGNYMGGERLFEQIIRVRLNYITEKIKDCKGLPRETTEKINNQLAELIKTRYPENTEDTIPGFLSNIISARISNFFNCNGANFTVDSICASSAIANDLAIKGLLQGKYEYVICGGSNSNLSPANIKALDISGLLSKGTNQIFDKNSDGVNPAEGAAVYILTTNKTAKKNNHQVYCELMNFFTSTGSDQPAFHVPDSNTYRNVIKEFYTRTPFLRKQVKYIELFGLGVLSCDVTENVSLGNLFFRPLYYGNLKPATGYLFSANTAAVMLKLALMNYHKTILPNWDYKPATTIITDQSPLVITGEITPVQADSDFILAMNYFGIGGNHIHGALASLPLWLTEAAQSRVQQTTPLSIKNSLTQDINIKKGKIAILLSGQGAQYAGMMKELYYFDETVHFTLDEGDKIFRRVRGYSILDIIFNNEQLLKLTMNTQPAIFLASAAIYNSLKNKGFKPDYFIGHSLGEFTALYCAGILDFKEALKLIIKRSDIMHHTATSKPGAMVAVFCDAKETRRLIEESQLKFIYLANMNSEEQTVISGENYKINQFVDFLKKQNVPYKKINVTAAFHTPLFKEASRELADYLSTIQFNNVDFSTVFSNTTGKQYPNDEPEIKLLLERQMISTVKFVTSIKNATKLGVEYFIEIGPSQVLSKLLDQIDVNYIINLPVVHKMYGEVKSFNKLIQTLNDLGIIQPYKGGEKKFGIDIFDKSFFNDLELDETEFNHFITERKEKVNKILYQEFEDYRKSKEEKKLEKLGIFPGKILISGVAIGLPGLKHSVFNRNNFEEIISGTNYIETLPYREKRKILEKNITRLKKGIEGNARFQTLKNIEDVIQLAGQLGYFDLRKEYGIDYDYDITFSLAIAAGFEALKDANIPLIMQYKKTTTGSILKEGLALPEEMQESTGVIFASTFPGFESIIHELDHYCNHKYAEKALKEIEQIYSFLIRNITEPDLLQNLTDMYEKSIQKFDTNGNAFQFNRNLLLNIMSLGSAHFAQLIKARGPNTQVNSACTSTTLAIGVAEDWIRTNRCDRVIIIGADAATSPVLNEWIGSGFLAIGAATSEKNLSKAALPFDSRRNGMILGSGAVALIIEKQEEVKKRGFNGQAEILGTYSGNSAYHASRIDAEYLSGEMKKFINRIEMQYDLQQDVYTKSMLFMSHETYSPAKGGTAEAEISALKNTFPNNYNNIVITNTKGYTGNTLAASIEDAVLIKSLQKHRAPGIANLKKIPEEFQGLKFSTGRVNHYEYGLHLATGFGSQFAFVFYKRIEENIAQDNKRFEQWLQAISRNENAQIRIHKHILSVDSKPVFLEKTPDKINHQDNNPEMEKVNKGIIENIRQIISGQTGYTPEMLEDNLDFEADLGIDTVKQVQIFGKISANLNFNIPEDLRLREVSTVSKLATYVKNIQATAEQKPPAHTGYNEVSKVIKRIITEQTGYTNDMLDENLDFEADLGIDTVKQVQIFGKIFANFSLDIPEDIRLDKMNTITKLEKYVIDKQAATTTTPVKNADSPARHARSADENTHVSEQIKSADHIGRYTIQLIKIPSPAGSTDLFRDGTFLITRDQAGFADELAEGIKAQHGKVIMMGNDPACDFMLDFNNFQELEKQLMDLSSQLRDLTGIIHLLPLDYYFNNKALSEKAIFLSIKFFFLLIRNFHHLLNNENRLISILSFHSLLFPYRDSPPENYPVFAGLAGMMKSINKELPHTIVKAVDFYQQNPLENRKQIIDTYLRELMSGDKRTETGYHDNQKFCLSLQEEAVFPETSIISNGDTILIAGGARGITYEILKELVKRNQLLIIILGRSVLTGIDEKYLTDSYLQKKINEQELLSDLAAEKPDWKPLKLKQAAHSLANALTTWKNIRHLESLGAKIDYYAVDIRDAQATEAILNQYEKITGVIFSAGIENSNYLLKKELNAFEAVFDTKVSGVLNIIEALEKTPYRYFIAFSSVTAKVGNAAQTDYTAANDMLGKIILNQKHKYPERFYKIFNWTAWQNTGMAAGESVQKVLTERGIRFLTVRDGVRFFLNEICDKKSCEITIASVSKASEPDKLFITRKPSFKSYSFLSNLVFKTKRSRIFSYKLDLQNDIFLQDHTKDNIPILPGAVGLEIMAEAAASLMNNQDKLCQISDFSIPYGIKILKGKPKEIFIRSEYHDDRNKIYCTISSHFENPEGIYTGSPTLHYQGVYHFKRKPETPPRVEKLPHHDHNPDNIIPLIYQPNLLFMGQQFRSIKNILDLNENSICTLIFNPNRNRIFSHSTSLNLITDPVVMDAIFQSCAVLEMHMTGSLMLPYNVHSMHFYDSIDISREYICSVQKLNQTDKIADYQTSLFDKEGNQILKIDKMNMIKIGDCPPGFKINFKGIANAN